MYEMYDLLGICVVLLAALIINASATVGVTLIWRVIKRPAQVWSAATRATLLFMLRGFPMMAALVGVLALVTPAYLVYEPSPTHETISIKLLVLAFLSAAAITFALWRGFCAWRATRALVTNWLRDAEPVTLCGINIPAYTIRHPFPVIAVVGIIRPRLFVAAHVFDALDAEELAAAIRHEAGHLAARDNLKRWLLVVCRSLMVSVPVGSSLERAWKEAAEIAADDFAARSSNFVALDLASALIKVARLIPANTGAHTPLPAGAYLVEDETSGVAERVRRLTQMVDASGKGERHGKLRASAAAAASWSCACAFCLAAVCVAADPRALGLLHTGIERVVAWLN